ncbi:hypothetical protein BD779DRAFT_1674277 [Infundibulicybe gibba]|nr:hypothetical protein BD779DRAFT_1674277 [Infundibulicybe gibba]
MDHTIFNLATKTSARPDTGVLPLAIISREDGTEPTSWHIVRLDNGNYQISNKEHYAVGEGDVVLLYMGRKEEWKIQPWPDYGSNVYSISRGDDEGRGWVLEDGTPKTPIQCVTLPPTGNAMWVIEPPLA